MSLLALLQLCCVAVFALLLVAAGWQDLKTMRIANSLSIGIGASFVVWAAAGVLLGRLQFLQLGLALVCAAGVFVLGALGFAAGAIGGGDVKLLAVASLFAGPSLQFDFLAITALVGGVLGLAILAGAPIGPAGGRAGGAIRSRLQGGLPYGPAIAVGGLWVAASLAVV
ncbi:MAG: prepilin peptidase [Proteobacteria bacterium]|nr:prepilin peptidase [Pseudomonadota bacterium]